MQLVNDWKKVVKKGWQFRLNILSALLSAAEFLLPYINEWHDIPRGLFAILSVITILSANVARVISQKEFRNDEQS